MRYFYHYMFVLLMLASCKQTQDREPVTQQQADIHTETSIRTKKVEKTDSIRILNTGPRGGAYQNSKGDNFRYTVFRVEVLNHASQPIQLDLNLPKSPTGLLPDATIVFQVFLVPEKYTPDTIQDTFNFGAKLEALFESGDPYQFELSTAIEPNNHQTLYIGILLKSQIIDGATRAKLFVEGQDQDAPFIKVVSQNNYKLQNKPINLVYGVSVASAKYHTLIPCGQIKIE